MNPLKGGGSFGGNSMTVALADNVESPFDALEAKLRARASSPQKAVPVVREVRDDEVDAPAAKVSLQLPPREQETVAVVSVPSSPSSSSVAIASPSMDLAINGAVFVGIGIAAVAAFFAKRKSDDEAKEEAERLRQREIELATKVLAEKAEARRKQEELVRSRALEEAALKLKKEQEAELKASAEREAEEENQRKKRARAEEARRVAAEKQAETERKRALQEAAMKLKEEEEAAARAAAAADEANRERARQEQKERAAAEAKARAAAKAAEEIRIANQRKAEEEAAAEATRRAKAEVEEREQSARLLLEARQAQMVRDAEQDALRVNAVKSQALRLSAALAAEIEEDNARQVALGEATVKAVKSQASRLAASLEESEQSFRVSAVKKQAATLARQILVSEHSATATATAAATTAATNTATTTATTTVAASTPSRATGPASSPSPNLGPSDAVLDAIQESCEQAFPGETPEQLTKKFDEVITLLAKAPVRRLRELITARKPEALPDAQVGLDGSVKVALEALWASTGTWEGMNKALHDEMDPVAADATKWMRVSVTVANELTETRIKEMIKTKGGGRVQVSRPKNSGKRSDADDPAKKSSISKSDYVTILVETLRAQEGNDYQRVAELLQKETTTAGKKKGFATK